MNFVWSCLFVLILSVAFNAHTYAQAGFQNPNITNSMGGSFGNTWGGNNATYAPDTTQYDDDSTKRTREPFTWKHNPRLATLFALVPGAGQVYNGNYWKVPIVWGLLATLSYLVVDYDSRYKDYREAYIILVETDSSRYGSFNLRNYDYNRTRSENFNTIRDRRGNDFTPFDIDPTANASRLTSLRDFYRRNRDLIAVLTIFSYLLNIADAAVDAHFAKFDVSDNLSMQLKPVWLLGHGFQHSFGAQVKLHFVAKKTKPNLIF